MQAVKSKMGGGIIGPHCILKQSLFLCSYRADPAENETHNLITRCTVTTSIEFAALTDVFYKGRGTDQRGAGCQGMLLNLDESEKQLLLAV